jgi:hypothetical protein
MRIDKPLAAVLTASALLAGGVAVAQSSSGQQAQDRQTVTQPSTLQQQQRRDEPQQQHQTPRQDQAARAPMTLRQVIDRVEQAGYRDVREVEREDGGWEVYATDAHGRRVELYVDGRGQIRLDD